MKTKTLGCFLLKDNIVKIPMINLILNFQKGIIDNNEYYIEKTTMFKRFIESLNENKDYVELNGVKFEYNSEILVLFEIFSEMGNAPFSNVKDKVILDIGANIGDTALLFANDGAKVYSFEPVPPTYENALRNIKLNPNLEDKIHLFNKAVSDKNEIIEIKFSGCGKSLSSSIYSDKGESYNVESISLNKIISNLKNEGIYPNFLHMDCEGSEFDIIPNSDLSIFEEVVIEHHQKMVGKNHKILLDILIKQGFEIKKKISWGNSNFEDIGIIYAVKKNNN